MRWRKPLNGFAPACALTVPKGAGLRRWRTIQDILTGQTDLLSSFLAFISV
jgi:hypothetical protein